MFKYKSPLSRLLEGKAKTENKDDTLEEERNEAEEEPIADLNALRQILAGGNQAAETTKETAESAATAEVKTDDVAPVAAEEDATKVEASAAQTEEAGVDVIVNTILAEDVPAEDASNATDPSSAETEASEIAEVTTAKIEPEQVAKIEPVVTPVPVAAPALTPVTEAKDDRSERVKTTFLGFERHDTHVQDSMEAAPVSKQDVDQNTFPVAWLVITEGPGRGTSFSLIEGLAQIGRNDDQAIQLDFGDNGISRAGHAVVAYNAEDRTCYLGHGGKANLVRLNGGPVLSTVPLSNGDMIRISETTLRFVSFCGDNFDWQEK